MSIIQSLYIGSELTEMEKSSICSFLKHGFIFHLYIYNPVTNIPTGTIIKDASDIMSYKVISNLPFADIWRYKLLYERGNYWVDLDMICLKQFDFKEPYIFSYERTLKKGIFINKKSYIVNVGILKAPKGSPFYLDLYNKCLEYHHDNTNKNKIQYMSLLRNLVKKYKYNCYVKPTYYFCNLDWWHTNNAYKPLLTFEERHGIKSENSVVSLPSTVNFWSDISTNKYGIDFYNTNGETCLWALMKAEIDKYN